MINDPVKQKQFRIAATIGLLILPLMLLLTYVVLPRYFKHPGPAYQKLVVATDKMRNGPFEKAVFLMIVQDHNDTVGVRLNQPAFNPASRYNDGGPDGAGVFYTLHSLDISSKDTQLLPGTKLGYTRGDTFMMLIDHMGDKPQQHISYRGYTKWAPGQLQHDIAAGGWRIVNPTDDLIFHTPMDQMWDVANKLPDAVQK